MRTRLQNMEGPTRKNIVKVSLSKYQGLKTAQKVLFTYWVTGVVMQLRDALDMLCWQNTNEIIPSNE